MIGLLSGSRRWAGQVTGKQQSLLDGPILVNILLTSIHSLTAGYRAALGRTNILNGDAKSKPLRKGTRSICYAFKHVN